MDIYGPPTATDIRIIFNGRCGKITFDMYFIEQLILNLIVLHIALHRLPSLCKFSVKYTLCYQGTVSHVLLYADLVHLRTLIDSNILLTFLQGYDAHIASTVSEWFIGIAFVAFFLTYIKDFQKITMKILPELLVSHLDETPIIFTHAGPTERTGLLA